MDPNRKLVVPKLPGFSSTPPVMKDRTSSNSLWVKTKSGSTAISPLMGIGRLPVTIAALMYAIDGSISLLRRATRSCYLT